MLAEPSTTTPERDWLDLGPSAPISAPADAPLRPDRLEAVPAGPGIAARWQPILAARVAPLREAAGRMGGRVVAHPLAGRAREGWQQAGARIAALRWGRLAAGAAATLACLAAALLAYAVATLPRLDGPPAASSPIQVQAEDGQTLAMRGAVRGQALAPRAIAPVMKRAIVAAQDPWFHDAYRLDAGGIAEVVRLAFRDRIPLGPRMGAARLTQRLVRHQILDGRRGLVGKLQEAVLVLWLQARATPDEILTRFLNTAAFGPDISGIDAAAHRILGKAARDLSTAEAALLAGLTLPPADLRADRDVEATRLRARRVLEAMVMTGAVTRIEADESARALAGLTLPSASTVTRSGFPDLAVLAARDRLGEDIRDAALRTSLDRKLQGFAEAAIERRLDATAKGRGARTGLVALAPDGAVLALATTGSPLAADPAGRAAAEASLRRVTRDGRPVYDRLQAATLPAAAVRARAFALLAAFARLPEGADSAPATRDGVSVGMAGDVTVGVWVSSEDEGAAGAAPEAIWQDFAAKAREAREPPAREPGSPRAAWQAPEEKATTPVLRGTARVIDTGRLKVEGQTVRLFGVEGQGGRAAREFRQYLRKREVTCEPAGEAEVYRCRTGAQDLSEVVLFNGAGKAAPGATPELIAAEANAKARQAGVWQN
ncbi:transglycosylase domain-containing protein [Methylobacterium nodulans]|uniref:peptidoglycan glycosyltransferase n=1 Tax=Methylobacterium nodulans (strain LMG 21967 / CNCM I-2342 / ORS 2060) TaxID=460265 RepID=B8IJU8_METNO|nr:transglycosylase domain-containing protein [Methylobacterium nodulans]ACL59961.1 glycosyl transferase family 51 [Methylobacterium nodulans ORS 2060]